VTIPVTDVDGTHETICEAILRCWGFLLNGARGIDRQDARTGYGLARHRGVPKVITDTYHSRIDVDDGLSPDTGMAFVDFRSTHLMLAYSQARGSI